MSAKIIIIFTMILIIAALATGLVFLVKDGGKSKRTVKALTWRIALSVTLFICLLAAFKVGLIEPHGLRP